MNLKRDAYGRPIGLDWPERPPVAKEVMEKQRKKAAYSGGRERQTECGRGHDLSKTGREIPKERGGGRYCVACATITKRALRERKKLEKGLHESEQ